MSIVFIGGSRRISRLPPEAAARMRNIIANGHAVVVGDAMGVDKAVQAFLAASQYRDVTVFASGRGHRNNLGAWKAEHVAPDVGARGFHLHAAKDREMARIADFGLMIWDGESAGTALNVLRLLRAGKKVVLVQAGQGAARTFRTEGDWNQFIEECPEAVRKAIVARATPDELAAVPSPSASRRDAVMTARRA
jgi:hypothetical protein